jgi:hypothetical protein
LFGEIRVCFAPAGCLRGARRSAAAITAEISGDVDALVMSVRWGAVACVQEAVKTRYPTLIQQHAVQKTAIVERRASAGGISVR